MITDKSYWETLSHKDLINQVIEFDIEIDNVMVENARLRDEIAVLDNLLSEYGIKNPL